MKTLSLSILAIVSASLLATFSGQPAKTVQAAAKEDRRFVQPDAIPFQAGLLQPPQQPQQASPFAYRQLAGQKFFITGNVSSEGVVLSGAVSGSLQVAPNGNVSGVFNCPTLGLVNSSQGGGFTLTNNPPTIQASATPIAGRYLVSGTVGDDTPESRVGLTVSVILGFNQFPAVTGPTATVQSDGTWSVLVEWPVGYSRPAIGTAVVRDWYGLTASQAIMLP